MNTNLNIPSLLRRGRGRSLIALVAGAALAGQLLVPAKATGPLPPSCDPTKAGLSMPACPLVLLGELGDIENPTISLPDLVPDTTTAWIEYEWIDFDGQKLVFGPASITFDTRAQNLGRAPLDLQADDFSTSGSSVSQCISWTTNFICRERTPAGGIAWHEEHRHYHFNDFASYELRTLKPDGTPNFASSGLVSASPKVSLCLVDSYKIRPDALPFSRYTSCNNYNTGISPGYADSYDAGIDGQYLALNDSTDGRYALVVALNTAQHVLETNLGNNRVVVVVQINGLGAWTPQVTIVDKYLM